MLLRRCGRGAEFLVVVLIRNRVEREKKNLDEVLEERDMGGEEDRHDQEYGEVEEGGSTAQGS